MQTILSVLVLLLLMGLTNVFMIVACTRSKCGCKLVRNIEQIKDFLQTQTVVSIALLMPHIAATDAALKELKQDVARWNLGLEGQKLLALDAEKDQIVYMLREALERIVQFGSSTPSSSTWTSSTKEFNNDDLEIQSIPQLVFGMDTLNQQIQDVLLGSEHTGADDRDTNVELHPVSKWVGVWAKGGAGKTLLVQNAMNNPVVTAHFNNRVYAVVVGQSPNLGNLQGILYGKINNHLAMEINKPAWGKAILLDLLRGQKCLLILDDVWQEDHLDWFDVVSEEVGSRILITSRNQSVLQRVCATELCVLELSSENSMNLFCVHAFGGVERMPAPLEKLVKDVVAECKGLPLALKVVGSALAGKMDSRLWEKALHDLRQTEVVGKDYEEELFGRLKLSYDNLGILEQEGKVYKECFLYFAAFPEDGVIKLEHLVQLWVGDGLIGQQENLDPDIEAYCILTVLIGRSLIELISSSPFETTFKIHDVLRDMGRYILSCGRESWEQKCLFKPGWQPTMQDELPQGWLSFEDRGDCGKRDRGGCNIMQAKKLSLMYSSVSSFPSKMHVKDVTPPLRVLLLFKCRSLTELDGAFLGHFTNMRVLDLGFNTSIGSLPSAIGKLRELVVLNLQYSGIEWLPEAIGKLRKLQSLNLKGCHFISSVPFLSKLVSLKYLDTTQSGLEWGTQSNAMSLRSWSCLSGKHNLKALNCLVNLRKLCIERSDVKLFPNNAMSMLSQLRCVKLCRFRCLKALPDGMRNLCGVEELDLWGCEALEQLPSWVPERMGFLKTLNLSGCKRLSQIPSEICMLQHLVVLDLRACESLQCLPDEFGGPGSFPSLLCLLLSSYDGGLRAFPELQMGAFPKLLFLSLAGFSFRRLPESISLVGPHLRELRLENMKHLAMPSDETLKAFVKLEILELDGLCIDVLPSAVDSLPSLKRLKIYRCEALKTLPKPIIRNDWSARSYFPYLGEMRVLNNYVF